MVRSLDCGWAVFSFEGPGSFNAAKRATSAVDDPSVPVARGTWHLAFWTNRPHDDIRLVVGLVGSFGVLLKCACWLASPIGTSSINTPTLEESQRGKLRSLLHIQVEWCSDN
eukprot:4013026-Amphidinium_carterae.1